MGKEVAHGLVAYTVGADTPVPVEPGRLPHRVRRDQQGADRAGRVAMADAVDARRAVFLPSAQWEPVRTAFWARTGFPGDPTQADAICDRLLHDAHRLELEGPSMRRTKGAPKTPAKAEA